MKKHKVLTLLQYTLLKYIVYKEYMYNSELKKCNFCTQQAENYWGKYNTLDTLCRLLGHG